MSVAEVRIYSLQIRTFGHSQNKLHLYSDLLLGLNLIIDTTTYSQGWYLIVAIEYPIVRLNT